MLNYYSPSKIFSVELCHSQLLNLTKILVQHICRSQIRVANLDSPLPIWIYKNGNLFFPPTFCSHRAWQSFEAISFHITSTFPSAGIRRLWSVRLPGHDTKETKVPDSKAIATSCQNAVLFCSSHALGKTEIQSLQLA